MRTVAEDTVDAIRCIPQSLLWSKAANTILCIMVALLICLTAGDVATLFEGPHGGSLHPIGSIIQLTSNAARGRTALASAPFGMILPIVFLGMVYYATYSHKHYQTPAPAIKQWDQYDAEVRRRSSTTWASAT